MVTDDPVLASPEVKSILQKRQELRAQLAEQMNAISTIQVELQRLDAEIPNDFLVSSIEQLPTHW